MKNLKIISKLNNFYNLEYFVNFIELENFEYIGNFINFEFATSEVSKMYAIALANC